MSSENETLDRGALEGLQLQKLQEILALVLKQNPFYQQKLRAAGIHQPEDVQTLADYRRLPFTTKAELSADQDAHRPYGTNLTFPLEHFIRIHQTSGTTGKPLRWLDTEESWDWFARCWESVYRGAGVTAEDRLFFAFSFGPFIGFWTAHEGARTIGAMSISGGAMSSIQRLQAIEDYQATVLVCTPTYALHLAEVAEAEGIDIAGSSIRTTIHAGEPGASLPGTKGRIEQAWDARCYDHVGATEVGAWGFECHVREGMHLNEGEFICEVIDPDSDEFAAEGELVITNLGRVGMPVIRYRTGDRVKLQTEPCACGRTFFRLEGGVIGRLDDAMIIRGVNVYPSSIENVVRGFPEVTEFAVDIYQRHAMDDMEIRMEVNGGEPGSIAEAVAKEVRHVLGIRTYVQTVPNNTLPRFELKARRFTDHR
ncbi:MAG: phenylacetate--CoA ligase family protein [bacterium]|nr:phenylacetate--CoA ligase family protein [bacterium]